MKRVSVVAFLLVVATACTQTSSTDTPQATTTTDAVISNAQVTYTVSQIANVPGAVDIVERRSEDNWIYIVGRNGIVERWNRSSNTRIDQVLNMQSFTTPEGERGLLGLAFRERNNSWTAFVNYTNTDGNTTIAAFPVRDDGTFDSTLPSGIEILVVEQPYANHNGGGIAVGPDNMVYIGLGDGGSGGDPQRYALDTSSLLGKMLRINPRDNGGYDIPSDNPYVATPGARGEIWSIGLRNPWRYSFDTQGNLWIADVGERELE
jgi:glucose/arabinose dehydrogenase